MVNWALICACVGQQIVYELSFGHIGSKLLVTDIAVLVVSLITVDFTVQFACCAVNGVPNWQMGHSSVRVLGSQVYDNSLSGTLGASLSSLTSLTRL